MRILIATLLMTAFVVSGASAAYRSVRSLQLTRDLQAEVDARWPEGERRDARFFNRALCLVRTGADVNSVSKKGSSLLGLVFLDGTAEMVFNFIGDWRYRTRAKNVNLTVRDGDQSTLLHLACLSSIDVVKKVSLLCQLGVDVNAQRADGDTALHITCSSGCYAAVRTLLKYKADTTVRNKAGLTPLEVAQKAGHEACVAILLALE